MNSGYRAAAVVGAIFGLAALLVSIAALNASTPRAAANANADAKVSAAAAQTIDVELGDLYIKPAMLMAAPGSDVTLRVHNAGGIPHNLSIADGAQTPLIQPSQTTTLHVGAINGTKSLFCSVPGHKEAGMAASLMVDANVNPQTLTTSSTKMTAAQMDASYLAGIKAFPAATTGKGNEPLAARIADGVKVFDLTAADIKWEVAPGEFKQGMAFNGMIPGPVIHVALGDRVRVVLHNQLHESTALHFHGLIVPNDMDGVPGITQPLVQPGETFTYEFTVKNAGTHMYHSHMDSATQVPEGLLGAFIVDGPSEPVVAHDELMVLNDGPLGYTINGKGFPATAPLVAKQGERIRIRYMNEGMQIHPMHLHGMQQTVIALDGNPVPQQYEEDTVMVAPGQRVDVLVTASELGIWAFHCHILTHAETEQGMYGMVTALIVQK